MYDDDDTNFIDINDNNILQTTIITPVIKGINNNNNNNNDNKE